MDGTPINLFEVKAKFTALYFWDPDCGNCSKTTDKLVPVYNKWKDKGFEVFGVCSKSWKDIDKCKKKIEDKAMDFINTSDEAYPLAVAKKIYDIKVNPFLILLDEDKKIMWKRIDPNQLDDILKREFGVDTDESQEKP
jgi:peroxiredoxin